MGKGSFERAVLGFGGTSYQRKPETGASEPVVPSTEVADDVHGLTYEEIHQRRRLERLEGDNPQRGTGFTSKELLLSLEHIPHIEHYKIQQELMRYAVEADLLRGVDVKSVQTDVEPGQHVRVFEVDPAIYFDIAKAYRVPNTRDPKELVERIRLVRRIDQDCPGFRDTVLVEGRVSKNSELIEGAVSMYLGPGDGSMMGGVNYSVDRPDLAGQRLKAEVEMALYAFIQEILDAKKIDRFGRLILSGDRRVPKDIRQILIHGNATVPRGGSIQSTFRTAVYKYPTRLGQYDCIVIKIEENGPDGKSQGALFFTHTSNPASMQDVTAYASSLRFI